ncbi:MAG TPA: hydrolase [Candidatus Accumulibacter phosphatis]|nr:MAG: putative hydrolase [Candidatus Accumulibacter sp. SK-11]HAY27091.1 hydrolase [Accumulibacter sp.]HRL77505.1 hydrolase [Candidatus Accumulibacter phosphatis]HRQ95990.1 hydrolase [Candidatus Accumulibacter phosphatis]
MIPYRAPGWLPGGHLQTVYPLLIRPDPLPCHRQRWETPDGDFIDLDWVTAADASAQPDCRPLLVIFHGLEGSSNSHYALTLLRAAAAVGWAAVAVNFRGCSGESNRLPRAYHSGDSEEIDWILRRLQTASPARRHYAVGVSLGGNALLKWLGESGTSAMDCLHAAVAVSAPVDLAACGHHLAHGFNRVYTRHFLHSLKRSAAGKLRRYPGLFDERRMRAARNLYEFDDVVTAPLHGFSGADDYWRRASSKPWLGAIRLPTLLLNAVNDPFLPAQALPAASQVGSSVRIDFPRHGGHVGFVTGSPPGQLVWLPQRILHYFQHEV